MPAELALFIPFYWAVRRHVTRMPWLRLCGVPILATAANIAVTWGLERGGLPTLVALIPGFLAYLGVLTIAGVFRSEDFSILLARLPQLRLPAARRGAPRGP
jgi:hypothetical protein